MYDLQRLGIKVGLEHTFQLLERCGNPQDCFKSIHIAGTNGKGSTSAMLASILKGAGYTVGLYTSPHLIRFNERVRVDGIPIPDEKIVEFVSLYKSDLEEIKSTFFEATTALAFNYFKDENVDVAVVETGLGGRLDSTNVLKPTITIITSITADHTEILGKDLSKIAFEKGGIIKNNIPLVLSPQCDEVDNVLLRIAKEKNAALNDCKKKYLNNVKLGENGTEFSWNDNQYKTNLIGEHQASNAVLAIEAAKLFDKNIKHESIVNGLKNVIWPGRLQSLSNNKHIYYDVAHNPHGIEVVLETLSNIFNEKPIGLLALKADKELDKIAPILRNKFSKLIITSQAEAGLMDSNNLHISLLNFGIDNIIEMDIYKAMDYIEKSVSKSKPGLIFGSHYIGKSVFEKFGFFFDKGVI